MKPGIEVVIVYSDEDLLELLVRGSNGVFSGEARTYTNLETPRAVAETLRGFPTSRHDVRSVQLGAFDTASAGGGAALRFYCLDSAGHAAVDIRFRTDSRYDGSVDEARFHIRIEAAAVDSFVNQLSRMSSPVGDAARVDAAG
jgi:hypothetical protein